MNEQKARDILGKTIRPDRQLLGSGDYISWSLSDQTTATLDGDFTADELEAIAWWMRNNA